MALNLDQQSFMNSLVAEIKQEQLQVIDKMLGEAIKKGIIQVRQSDPVLVLEKNPTSGEEKVKLMHHAVIDYIGAEKIEELEKALEYMTKVNADLHNCLSEFYEKTKANTWLKNQK